MGAVPDMAVLLAEYASEPGLDLARVLKMVIVHDLVEIERSTRERVALESVGPLALDHVDLLYELLEHQILGALRVHEVVAADLSGETVPTLTYLEIDSNLLP